MAHAGLICLGPFEGKDQAFVLLDTWAPPARRLPERDEALAELAFRYFTSHGPATEADFAWWANLTLTDVRAAIHDVTDRLASITIDHTTWHGSNDVLALKRPLPGARSVHALPGFDENLLGYRDRSAALAPAHSQLIVPGNNGMFKSTIVVGGRVVGTWSRAEKPTAIQLTAMPFTELGTVSRSALVAAARRYGRFKEKPVELVYSQV
jgi:hypothetical protein